MTRPPGRVGGRRLADPCGPGRAVRASHRAPERSASPGRPCRAGCAEAGGRRRHHATGSSGRFSSAVQKATRELRGGAATSRARTANERAGDGAQVGPAEHRRADPPPPSASARTTAAPYRPAPKWRPRKGTPAGRGGGIARGRRTDRPRASQGRRTTTAPHAGVTASFFTKQIIMKIEITCRGNLEDHSNAQVTHP